ncbi:MAG TPA: winged helix-turn-helix domain-containing protein [Solirubrobacteraceae bacterium]|nr:winged helix-turn-helix domain-containing protein [Solirubrobacteraceae bacterium]
MPFDRPRELTDPLTMRALAHPARLSLLEALTHHGQLTATEAAEHVGESPSNCSFHLRQLAKYGFVEEAEGGTGRRRPWRVVSIGTQFSDVHEDPETALAAGGLARVIRERLLERARAGLEQSRLLPDEWRAVLGTSDMTLYVTPEEMGAIGEEMLEVLFRYRERIADRSKRPEGSRPIQAAVFAYPIEY